MIKSYFTIALRNLLRNKGYSFINIGGLATGMAIAMLIGLWIVEELSFDGYHPEQSRVVRVMQHQTYDGTTGTQRSLPMPVGNTLRAEYGSDFTYVALVDAGDRGVRRIVSHTVNSKLPGYSGCKRKPGKITAKRVRSRFAYNNFPVFAAGDVVL